MSNDSSFWVRDFRISGKGFFGVLVGIVAIVGVLAAVANFLPTPRFVLNAGGSTLSVKDQASWQRWLSMLDRRKYLLLTFDDGPYGEGVDEQILATLKKHHAHALFFLQCNRITPATGHVLAEIEAAGDLIGNHSYSHPHLPKLDDAELRHQIVDCRDEIASRIQQPLVYYRPPFGDTSPHVLDQIRAAGMLPMLWDANSEDSWQKEPQQILHWSLTQSSNLSILLMHSKPTTEAELDDLLTKLEQRGFRFVLPEH